MTEEERRRQGQSDGATEPLDRWLAEVTAAPIPRSARDYAPELHAELVHAVRTGEPSIAELAERLKDTPGTDRRSRCLRILDRLGLVERALTAVSEGRRRHPA
jgi:hypothetical protein